MLKRILCFVCFVFIAFVVHAESISMQWLNEDGTTYDTTACTAGGDIILPTAPTKRGYTFMGWTTYTPIQYIKSSGTQYIDTGIKVNSDYTVEVRGLFNCGQVACGEENATFGRSGTFALAIACTSEGSVWGGNTINSTQAQLGTNPNNFFTLKIDKNGVYNDGVKKVSFSPPALVKYATKNFLLFATKASNYGWSSDTLMYVKMWDENNILIHNFIPVIDENNVPCMFDTVTGQFFYNAGTGNFIAGPVISQ